jgi:hypothetical protein
LLTLVLPLVLSKDDCKISVLFEHIQYFIVLNLPMAKAKKINTRFIVLCCVLLHCVVVMPVVSLLSVIILSVIILNAVILSITTQNAGCHNSECHYTQCDCTDYP